MIELSVESAIDEYVADLEEEREPDGKFHPSSIWGCDRRAVYTLRGVAVTDQTEKDLRRMRVGTILHRFVQAALLTALGVVEAYPEFSIDHGDEAGNGDTLVELEDGTFIVVELKTMGRLVPFREKDRKQARQYSVAARTRGVVTESGTTIDALGELMVGALLVYVDKVTMAVREEFMPYAGAWEQDVADRIDHLRPYRDDLKSLPPRLAAEKGKRAAECFAGCPFVSRCYLRSEVAVLPVAWSA